eukprot:scaffold4079_cov44-Cyclotella_meneghiniana.AAC.11
MANEGVEVEVLEANNHRVATAKKAVALTKRNLQAANFALEAARKAAHKAIKAAKKSVDVAQKEDDEANEELQDAKRSLKAAQKKWDVVDLVEEDEEDPDAPEEIIVKGCGVAEVNGTYKRIGDYQGAPRYSRKGKWRGDVRFEIRGELKQGEDVEFFVQRFDELECWFIRVVGSGGRSISVYGAEIETSTPPKNGWETLFYGVGPPPKITHTKKLEVVDLADEEENPQNVVCNRSNKRPGVQTGVNARKKARSHSDSGVPEEIVVGVPEEIVVAGCGIAEVNGTYKRDGDIDDAPKYSKKGKWEGKTVTFEIYQGSYRGPAWFISIRERNYQDILGAYLYYNEIKTSVPPSDGWRVFRGIEPLPKITLKL